MEPPAISETHERALLEDIKSIYGFQHQVTTVRGVILGACLTLIGAIIAYAQSRIDIGLPHGGFRLASIQLTLLGIAFSTVMIIGAMNRAQFVFGAYIDCVQCGLKYPGFWSCLRPYLETSKHKDTITHGYAIGVMLISYAITFYVALGTLDYFVVNYRLNSLSMAPEIAAKMDFGSWLVFSSSVAAVAQAIWTRFHVRSRVDTSQYGERISDEIKIIVDRVIFKKTPDTEGASDRLHLHPPPTTPADIDTGPTLPSAGVAEQAAKDPHAEL